MPAHLARRLLASAALLLAGPACGNPTPIGDQTMVGAWEGASAPYPVVLTDGAHNVTLHARFTFERSGEYSELQYLVDEDRHLTLGYTQASNGHFLAIHSRIILIHREELVRDPHSPYSANATLASVTPREADYMYRLTGNTMVLTPACPSNADCIPPLPPLQRMAATN